MDKGSKTRYLGPYKRQKCYGFFDEKDYVCTKRCVHGDNIQLGSGDCPAEKDVKVIRSKQF